MLLWLGLTGCLINYPLYEELSAELADEDGDGAVARDDCDDSDATRYPGAAEVCDGVDNDCNDVLDDGLDAVIWYIDGDGDGFGSDASEAEGCEAPVGSVDQGGDCDDDAPAVYPGAEEVCNQQDDDCNGSDDDGLATETWYTDADGDGWGDDEDTVDACEAPSGTVSVGGDCDDGDATTHPEAVDAFDGADNNCDGAVDVEDITLLATPWTGSVPYGRAGEALDLSDIDGDGHLDLVVGAPGDDSYTDNQPAVYLVYGPLSGGGSLDDADVIVRDGEDSGFGVGIATSAVSDGMVFASARDADWTAATKGVVVLISGRGLGTSDASEQPTFYGDGTDSVWIADEVWTCPDWNGDGVDEVVVPDEGAEVDGVGNAGVLYMIGADEGAGLTRELAHTVIRGPAERWHFGQVACGADTNGDGYQDVAGAAPDAEHSASLDGVAYLLHGGSEGDLSAEDAAAWVVGEHSNGRLGQRMWLTARDDDGAGDAAAQWLVGQGGSGDGWSGGRVMLFEGDVEGSLVLPDWSFAGGGEGWNAAATMGPLDSNGDLLLGVPEWEGSGGASYRAHSDLGGAALESVSAASGLLWHSAEGAEFGAATRLVDGEAAIGAPGVSVSASSGGAIYVYGIVD